MKTENRLQLIYLNREFRYLEIGFPEKPIKRESFESHAGTVHMGGDFGYSKTLEKFESALRYAISQSIRVDRNGCKITDAPPMEGQIYPIPKGYCAKIEKRDCSLDECWIHEKCMVPDRCHSVTFAILVPKPTATETLRDATDVDEATRKELIASITKACFEALFVHFHALKLKSHIDFTFEQDGKQYQLLFRPIDALADRNAKIELLEKYSKFLEKNGYIDSDWRDEKPYAIDEFLKQK